MIVKETGQMEITGACVSGRKLRSDLQCIS